MKKVAIMCELKEREIQFLSILKAKIELSGFNVKLISQRVLTGFNLLRFQPDIIIVNGLRSDINFYKQILIPKLLFGSKIITIYSEQIGRLEGIADTYDNRKILDSVDAHLTWGEGFAEGLLKLSVPHEKIWVVGSMALDLIHFIDNYDNKVKKLFAKKYALDVDKKWILISDNIMRRGDQVEVYEKIRDEFNEKIRIIANKLPDCEFIFRPHPDNKDSDLVLIKQAFNSIKNINIIGEEHNIFWSLIIDVMIVWRSTSSIEAWTAKKEVFALQTSENKFDYWHENLIPNFFNADILAEKLRMYLENDYCIEERYINERKQYMHKWFYQNDGESFDRISFVVHLMSKESEKIKSFSIALLGKIIQSYSLEIITLLSKIVKGEFRKFYVRKSDSDNALLKLVSIKSRKHSYEIQQNSFGNVLKKIEL